MTVAELIKKLQSMGQLRPDCTVTFEDHNDIGQPIEQEVEEVLLRSESNRYGEVESESVLLR